MYYEINVSYKSEHYFATSDRSIRNITKAANLYKQFCLKFPKEEGYKVEVKRVEIIGYPLTPEQLLK